MVNIPISTLFTGEQKKNKSSIQYYHQGEVYLHLNVVKSFMNSGEHGKIKDEE
jgi:hypothetical protein